MALTFATRPEHSTAFGARVVDDHGRLHSGVCDGMPWLHFDAWDEDALRVYNRVDMSAIAHRRGALRFDPELAYFGDWDLLIRLTANHPPAAVPAIAVYYRTDSPGRLSTSMPEDELEREYQLLRERHAAR